MVDLNVDAALYLKDLVGIDSYPSVLALLPNIYRIEDRDRVRAVLAEQLGEAGVLVQGGVHPVIEHWLHCLYRPDVELVARVVDIGPNRGVRAMLRMSLVRSGDTHVLAVRCDDRVVLQAVFDQQRSGTLGAALSAALGPCPALDFAPVTAPLTGFAEVPAERSERRRALLQLGASPHTASVLSRALEEVVRRAEVLLIEHQDGGPTTPQVCLSVLDTEAGRIAVTPSIALDGEVRSTYTPGDRATLDAGIAALIELLPGRSWFGTSRIR